MTDSLIFQTRSERAKAARAASLEEWFKERRWRVMVEATGERRQKLDAEHTAVVRYDHGEFWVISPEGVFQTPIGHKGRHGLLIMEIDPVSTADIGDAPQCFGHAILAKAQELYSCFAAGLPRPRTSPPRR